MRHDHRIKLQRVFKIRNIGLIETKMPRGLPPGWSSFNVTKTKQIETPYVILHGKVLIIHDDNVKQYIKHIAEMKMK